jgi:cholesterol transport system auxiliary component
MNHRMKAFLSFALVLSGMAIGGCGQGTTAVQEHYIVEASRKATPIAASIDATLEVRRLTVDAAFASKNLIYRTGQFKYEPDFYREFLISPSAMITEQTRRWLADSGLFKQVLPTGSQIEPMYTLEGTISALYGDFRDESAPQAVLEIRYFLVDHKTPEGAVVFWHSYRAANPISSKTVQAFMDALSQALAEILTRLEADLQTTLTEQSGKTG